MTYNYEKAGVNINLADAFVEKINSIVKPTYDANVHSGVGGYASLYKIDENRFIAATTDGVGTKLKLAIELNDHSTIGYDLVAMSANDLICTGAKPLFFLDYFATGKLEMTTSTEIISSIAAACKEANMLLLGGETAEMPDMYKLHDYDLAGFAVGIVDRVDLYDAKNLKAGDSLVGISSSGFHSNGFSLLRKCVLDYETDLKKSLLTPTKIYVQLVDFLRKKLGNSVKGMAHITGGGFTNIPRISAGTAEEYDYIIDRVPNADELPPIFAEMMKRTNLSAHDLYQTFNMGVGLVIVTDKPEELIKAAEFFGDKAWKLGHMIKGKGQISIETKEIQCTYS